MDVQFGALVDEALIARADELEAVGYDSLWVSEHILFYVPMLDAVAQLGALAGRTKRVKLGSAIFLLPLRHPTTVAKSFGSLDVLSDGRAILGIGVGGEYAKEFEACGIPVNERGARTNESMRLIKRLWTEENVTHDGKFFHVSDATMEPKPVQAGGPPMVVAGRSEAAQRRAARLGDGYMPYLFTPERYSDSMTKIRDMAAEAGRDTTNFQWCLHQFIAMADTHEEAHKRAVERLSRQYNQDFENLVERYCVLGTPEECAARLVQFAEAGVRHFILVPMAPAEEMFDHVMGYQTEIAPLVRKAIAAK